MQNDKCYRITPAALPWSNASGNELAERELFASEVVRLREIQLPPAALWTSEKATLCLVTEGSLDGPEDTVLERGDLCWCQSDPLTFTAGPAGARAYCMTPADGIGRDVPSQTVLSTEIPWENFDDPAGRPTQPVQVLLNGSLSALRTRFDPDYIAGEHWHDFDTLYFISDGRMQFGDEGWFEQGDIRAVHGGHSYGPERPGTNGVEFVLISLGGPVALHWSDLEPPP